MTFNILLIIILLTVIVSYSGFSNKNLVNRLIFVPHEVQHKRGYLGILGHTLIHADWTHLIFNMFSLYFLGNILLTAPGYTYVNVNGGFMDLFGPIKGQIHFFILYVFGALFATLIPYLRNRDNPSYRSLGASGAVSAVVFAAILWNPGMPLRLFFVPVDIPAFVFGPLYLLYEWYQDKKGNTGIAHDAHIGGAIFGIFYVLIINIDTGKEFIKYFTG